MVNLQVRVTNLGTAIAQGVYVHTGFDAGNNTSWNSQDCPSFQLGIDESVTISFALKAPYGKHTRLLIQIVYEGYTVDKSYSEWFDT